MRDIHRIAAVTVAVALTCAAALVATADAPQSPAFKVATKHEADKVTVELQQDRALISVRSPGGIGRAVIERRAANWPVSSILRLHLRSLENFRIFAGKSTLNVAVASHGDAPRIRVWKNDEEGSPLSSKDRFWIPVKILDKNGRPTAEIPLDGGHFELPLPAALFDDNPQSITLEWIDFYRN